jgi:hypothetical protein
LSTKAACAVVEPDPLSASPLPRLLPGGAVPTSSPTTSPTHKRLTPNVAGTQQAVNRSDRERCGSLPAFLGHRLGGLRGFNGCTANVCEAEIGRKTFPPSEGLSSPTRADERQDFPPVLPDGGERPAGPLRLRRPPRRSAQIASGSTIGGLDMPGCSRWGGTPPKAAEGPLRPNR